MTSSGSTSQSYATERETTEGRVFTVTGGDWDTVTGAIDPLSNEKIVVNMGPQHPSTHGVLRLVLELEGETVTEARCVIGYLHTGIEKNLEYRNWTQGTTFVTRADYLAPLFNEAGYVLGVEKLLGITDDITERAQTIRVLFMELNRISSHLVWLATAGMEIGAISMMLYGFREREYILDIFEETTGLRMNHAYFRPGGVANDIPDSAIKKIRDFLIYMPKKLKEYEDLLSGQVIWQQRTQGVAVLDVTGCLALGITGPVLRSAGLAWDMRKTLPYSGYENYEFDVPTATTGDVWGRYQVRMAEMRESLKIVEQALDRLRPGPIFISDKKIAWPAQLAMGVDGLGNSLEHVAKIMGASMESLIHHFKLVTEGFRVPAGQVYIGIEHPRGELGVHVVSDGGTHPYRVHMRDPSFVNLQAIPAMAEGALLADVIAGGASLDPVMGGCDR
ncbi:NADH-quinone oxidoreductase subunit D [Paractinoplanes ferrugineus]|uniref:NADH-quinone oxidoreductase subunit D n=1 Tax=Paractinoplanes ferrugineus TaxID=113564 RepID=A0A919MBS8_9ACTN|nr:NADH-quinone oxidoreductase subunit D [Actinoplanes ferrugineus]GIE13981.1 NADH-quinone oxidoreductase subunit D 2 [Actinoplanes ferrugineus]